MSVQSKELLERLDILAEKIDTLTKVTAISIQKETLLEGKKQKEQIELLEKMKIPRNVIALIVGTTPSTVRATLSRMKKKPKTTQKRGEQSDE